MENCPKSSISSTQGPWSPVSLGSSPTSGPRYPIRESEPSWEGLCLWPINHPSSSMSSNLRRGVGAKTLSGVSRSCRMPKRGSFSSEEGKLLLQRTLGDSPLGERPTQDIHDGLALMGQGHPFPFSTLAKPDERRGSVESLLPELHLIVSHHRIDFDAILDKLKDALLKMPECL